jgi:diguanylate cyclase (GGDEF)-like protein/PAS domain S-box-containing protein
MDKIIEGIAIFDMLEHLPAGAILTSGHEQAIIYTSRRFKEMFGYSLNDCPTIEKWWHLAFPDPKYRQSVVQKWNLGMADAMHQNREIDPLEVNITAKDGQARFVWIHASLVGGLYLVTFYDLTNRKRAKEALRKKTQELDIFFDVSMDLLCIADTEGNFQRLNPAWEQTLGFNCSELKAKKFFDFIHPDDWQQTLEATAQLASQNKISNFINRYQCKDGSYRWLEWQAVPLGSLIYAAARDITERKQAEEELAKHKGQLEERFKQRTTELDQANLALREASERLTLATQAASMGVWDLDFSNSLVSWDDKMFQIYGLPKIVPMPYDTWKKSVHPEDFDKVWASLTRTIDNKAYGSVEFRIIRPDGQIRWIAAAQGVVLDDQGDVCRLVGTSADITERKKVEEELRHSESRHRFLTENMKDVIWILDTETMLFRYHSPSVYGLWGFTPEEVMSKPALETMPPKLRDYLREQIGLRVQNFLSGQDQPNSYYTVEFEAPHKDGHPVWVESISRCHLNETTGHVEISGVTRDITARKKTEQELRESEARYRALVDHSPLGILAVQEGRFVFANPAGAALAGYSPHELLGVMAIETIHPDSIAAILDRVMHLENGESNPPMEMTIIKKNGELTITESTSVPIILQGKKAALILAQDITERKAAQTRLSASERHFRAFFERPLVGMATISPDSKWLEVNDQLCNMLGFSRDELLEKTWDELTYPIDEAKNKAQIRLMLAGESDDYTINKRCLRKDGSILYAQTSVSCLRKPDQSIDYIVVLVVDVTAQHEAQEQLRLAAHHDALTGLPNRRLLVDRLQQAVAKTKRHGGILAVAYLDLDGFKAINDNLGHAMGDQLLKEVATRLKSCLRGGDTVARLGGDEFVILLSTVTHAEECKQILGRLLKIIAAAYMIADTEQTGISTSIGVTLFPGDDADPEILLRHADQAMYLAKQNGRNRFYFFDGTEHSPSPDQGDAA